LPVSRAGSVATLNHCAGRMLRLGRASIEQTMEMATHNPARLLGFISQIGSLIKGQGAMFVRVNDLMNIEQTVIGSRMVFQNIAAWPNG
jgi:N-acetylglucosamine-6-phosphate deacetylase